MADQQPDITLYTAQTPNGIKISITLEELGLPYTVRKLDMAEKSEQKLPWFLEINPNGRIPALTDTHAPDGKTIRLFESGSIQQYLVATYDKEYKISFPPGTREFFEMGNWLFFMNAGVGPMQGQSNHFTRYCPQDIPYGRDRYRNETRRLYGVLEKHLHDTGADFLVGNKYTIADISHYGWITVARWAGVSVDEFPHVKAWRDRMEEREGVRKGQDVPEPIGKFRALLEDPEKAREFAEKGQKWIQKGMREDAEKGKK